MIDRICSFSYNDFMYYIANLVTRIAMKNSMSVYDVLVSLKPALRQNLKFIK